MINDNGKVRKVDIGANIRSEVYITSDSVTFRELKGVTTPLGFVKNFPFPDVIVTPNFIDRD